MFNWIRKSIRPTASHDTKSRGEVFTHRNPPAKLPPRRPDQLVRPASPVELENLRVRRRVLLRGEINDEVACECIAKLLFVAQHGSETVPINLWIDSPGGSITASLAILRVMNEVGCPVATTCTGAAEGVAAVIQAHGAEGKRNAVPSARFQFTLSCGNPQAGCLEGDVLQFDQMLIEYVAEDTRKHESEVAKWFHTNLRFHATQALENRLIDAILPSNSAF